MANLDVVSFITVTRIRISCISCITDRTVTIRGIFHRGKAHLVA